MRKSRSAVQHADSERTRETVGSSAATQRQPQGPLTEATRSRAGLDGGRSSVASAGTWTRERILDALRDWFELTGDRPRIYDWRPAGARDRGGGSPGRQLWEHEHPRWPSAPRRASG